MDVKFSDFVTALDRADSVHDAWQLGLRHFMNFDANHLCLTAHFNHRAPLIKWSTPDWVSQAFLEEIYPSREPVIIHCQNSVSPYFIGHGFETEIQALTPARSRFLDNLRQVDVEHGIVFPVKVPHGQQWGYFGFGTKLNQRDLTQVFREKGALIGYAGYAFFNRIESLMLREKWPEVRLTTREKECLLWLAKGFRNDRIANKMGVQPVTVEYHFKNCRLKLGAATREQSLAIAVMEGHINP